MLDRPMTLVETKIMRPPDGMCFAAFCGDQLTTYQSLIREVNMYLCKEVRPLDCDVVDAVKVLLRGVFQIAHGHDARIWDEDIDLAEFGDRGVNETVEIWELGSIGLYSKSSILADFLDEFVGGGGVGVVVEDDAGAFVQ